MKENRAKLLVNFSLFTCVDKLQYPHLENKMKKLELKHVSMVGNKWKICNVEKLIRFLFLGKKKLATIVIFQIKLKQQLLTQSNQLKFRLIQLFRSINYSISQHAASAGLCQYTYLPNVYPLQTVQSVQVQLPQLEQIQKRDRGQRVEIVATQR